MVVKNAGQGNVAKNPAINKRRVEMMNGQNRSDITPGLSVVIILKQDQRTGKLTKGIVKDLLTKSAFHSRGIKVRLEDGQVGRVQGLAD